MLLVIVMATLMKMHTHTARNTIPSTSLYLVGHTHTAGLTVFHRSSHCAGLRFPARKPLLMFCQGIGFEAERVLVTPVRNLRSSSLDQSDGNMRASLYIRVFCFEADFFLISLKHTFEQIDLLRRVGHGKQAKRFFLVFQHTPMIYLFD